MTGINYLFSKTSPMKQSPERFLLFVLLAVLAINGLAGGVLMILKPDGSLLGMEEGFLSGSPFRNYLMPGVLLFLFNGVLPALALCGLLARIRGGWIQKINIFPGKGWGWTLALYSGITTQIWIIVQQFFTSFFVLQPIISAFGIFIVITTLMPRVQHHYTSDPA
jgi:hypothetical protein